MTPEQTTIWLEIQHRQMLALERIAPNSAPNHTYPLENFNSFDWASIGATVVQSDQYGAAIVNWRGQQSPQHQQIPEVARGLTRVRA